MENIGQFLPFWLLGVPLLLAIVDWMRTPRTHADRHHTSLGDARAMPVR